MSCRIFQKKKQWPSSIVVPPPPSLTPNFLSNFSNRLLKLGVIARSNFCLEKDLEKFVFASRLKLYEFQAKIVKFQAKIEKFA